MAKLNTAAAITWTSGTGTERVLLLDVPLRDVRPGFTRTAFTAESLDKTDISTVTVGNGAHELVGVVRYEDDPQGLLDMVAAGAANTTLTYIPSLTDPDLSYSVKLISPRGLEALTLDLDAQRRTFGEMSVELRFRQTDETAFSEAYDGTGTLFSYRAGGSLADGTFSRADTATYVSKGYGTVTSAASGVARIHWMDTDSDGIRETPTLLLEGTSTNLITSSENFGAWSTSGTPVLTPGQSDPLGGTAAYLVDDDSAAAGEYIFLAPTFTGNTAKAISVFIKQGSATSPQIALRDTTAPADRLVLNITWAAGVPSVAVPTGTLIAVTRMRDGWYRLLARSTAVTAANTNQFWIRPGGGVSANTGTVYVFGAQAEDALNPSSYIPTSGATDARTRDALTFPFAARVQTLTCYLRYIQQGTLPWSATATPYLLSLGNTSTTESRLSIENTANASTLSVSLAGVAAGTSGTVSVSATHGQVVELVATVTYTPSARTATVRLRAVYGTTDTTGSASSAIAVSDGFAGDLLCLNGLAGGSSNDAFTLTTHCHIQRGSLTLESMRRLAGVTT